MVNYFSELLDCKKKKDLEKLCKSIRVPSEHFTEYIMACKLGITPLNHTMYYFDFVPPELESTEEDWDIFRDSKIDVNSAPKQKAITRLFKAHGKRQYRVGHMFISKELQHPISEWHFVFFEIKELHEKDNHWVMGQHVHLSNYLWPQLYCQNVWEDFILRKEFPKSKLHVPFIDESRRATT